MATAITFDQLSIYLAATLGTLTKRMQPMFMALGVFVDREVQQTFISVGQQGMNVANAANRTMWKGYEPDTLHPVNEETGKTVWDKWNERHGTDGSKGKYSAASAMNQKSGTFRKSFRIKEIDSQHMKYGTDHPIAAQLLKNRPVINYDAEMQRQFGVLVTGWIDKNLLRPA